MVAKNLGDWLAWLTRVRFLLITMLMVLVVILQEYTALTVPPRPFLSLIISYILDTTAPVCPTFKSQKTVLFTYVVVRSGPADLGKWMTESRNVLDDFKKIYGEAPGEDVGAISLAIDSNDTGSSAESFFGEILFRKP